MERKIYPIDLHTHSTKSDGSLTPTELIDAALKANLGAVALTDHDTTAGLSEAMNYAKDKPIQVIPGIELSTAYGKIDIHLIGLFIDPTSKALENHLKDIIEARTIRNKKMCAEFEKHHIKLSYEDLLTEYPESVITRAHYATYLYKHGHVKSVKEAFERYVGDNASCYIPREHITPQQGISIIKETGGIPILAHPTIYKMSKKSLEDFVEILANAGLKGIETTYSTYSTSDTAFIKRLAKKNHLMESGGSDFHGALKPTIQIGKGQGKLFVPSSFIDDFNIYLNNKKE